MKIKSIMSTDVKFIHVNSSLNDAACLMWDKDCGALPVLDNDAVVGMITDRDIAMAAYLQGGLISHLQVKNAMSSNVHFVNEEASLETALNIMRENRVRRLPVLDDHQKLVGIVAINDIVREHQSSRGKAIRAEQVMGAIAGICSHHAVEKTEVAA